MIPDNTLEEPGIDQIGYEFAVRLIRHLDVLETPTGTTRLVLICCFLKSFFFISLHMFVHVPFSAA